MAAGKEKSFAASPIAALFLQPDAIYYLREESAHGDRYPSLHDLHTHEDSRISSIVKPMYLGLSLSPDGRYLIYTQSR